MRMKWYQSLYVGPMIKGHEMDVRKKAAEGKLMAGVFYITLASNSENLLDIFHNGMLKQDLFSQNQCLQVVGIAEGKREAMWLVSQILKDILDQTGTLDVRAYFKKQAFVEY